MRITISGPPGSGKTTTCKMLSERLGLKAVVFGQIFRDMAAERGISLGELGAIAEKDSSVDKIIDGKILEIARANPDIILESRLAAYMMEIYSIPAFKVYLNASPDVRMSRVGVREGETLAEACEKTLQRQASEAKRYKMYYDIDINDLSVYDLVIDTDNISPEDVTDRIAAVAEKYRC